jgi:crossover junction endodeoxyribonuclease RuvC
LAVAAEAGIPVAQYSPNEVKQAVVGYGSATKDQVQRMVQAPSAWPSLPDHPTRQMPWRSPSAISPSSRA